MSKIVTIHINAQFACLPESEKGYVAHVTLYRPNEKNHEAVPRTLKIHIPWNHVSFKFHDHMTADHAINCVVDKQAVEDLLTPHMHEDEEAEVYIPLDGKAVLEYPHNVEIQ